MNSLINKYKEILFGSKFNVDLLWNLGSFSLCGIIGVLFNIIIINFYDSATLGFFNQVYAVFIFLSQISTWGLHLSVQKFIPQFSNISKHTKLILTSAFTTTFIFSFFITVVVFFFNKIPGRIFNSESVSEGFIYAVPGLFLFSLNKLLLSYLNGMRKMIAYAIFNFLRFLFMLLLLITIIIVELQPKFITSIFSIPELLLFGLLLIKTYKSFGFSTLKRFFLFCKIHFRFGSNAALGHIVLDLNSKVDVIILGIFLHDKIVGIYSFAAFIVDGLLQLFYVFRTNINPLITDAFYNKSSIDLEILIKRYLKNFYKFFIVIGIIAILIYPVFLYVFKIFDFFWLNYLVFSILTIGCILSSGYIPFQMIFNQVGKPRMQSIFLLIVFITNLILNLVLIPVLGIIGSALATSLTFVVQMFLLKKFTFNTININI
ncbi:MAG: polysaccharide biosynthesis C-terminal domain-containing protein [Candidatus Atribacteria bacterium]|nr:polysaccharide biosynthesis C-terminal domain-containing protein [Candidatus Atribacteria bacterium]